MQKINWPSIINELLDLDMTLTELSKELQNMGVKYSISMLSRLKDGVRRNPNHAVGQAILAIHQQKTRH